ncbi:MAG TPA: hypothetical protein VIK74_07225 [Parasegetibacter sp.]
MTPRKIILWSLCMLAYFMLLLHSITPHHHSDDLHWIDAHGHAHIHHHHHDASGHDHSLCRHSSETTGHSTETDCPLHIHDCYNDCSVIASKENQAFKTVKEIVLKVVMDIPEQVVIVKQPEVSVFTDFDSQLRRGINIPSESRGPPSDLV